MLKPQLTKDDRKALVILAVLLCFFIVYTLARQLFASSEKTVVSVAATTSIDSITPKKNTCTRDSIPQVKQKIFSTTKKYPGPPKRTAFVPKLKHGATLDINSADTTLLKRIPGIGSSYAKRIVKYRTLLGGYYCIEQLQEVYGMTSELYQQIAPFCIVRGAVQPIYISVDSIARHPYLSYRQQKAVHDLFRQEQLSWHELLKQPYFRKDDSLRLCNYLPFIE